MIDERVLASSKPGNRLLITKPGGGTNPMREPSGNCGSAARAGTLPNVTASKAKQVTIRRIMSRFLPGWSYRVIASSRQHRGTIRGGAAPPQCEVDTAAIRQKRGCSGDDPVNPVEGQP